MYLRKVKRIGNGTYGNVYEVIDDATQKTYAVKKNFISPNFVNTIGTVRELDILKKITGHPNCIQLINYTLFCPFPIIFGMPTTPIVGNFVTDKLYLVLEKGGCDGEKFIHGWKKRSSNPDFVKRKKPTFQEKILFAQNVALGLEFLHSRGIYHRDLKPGNIICYFDSSSSSNKEEENLVSAKITDFGLSQYYNGNILSLPGFVTPWYRAPEISLMKEYDFKSDVWSYACILFELFSVNNKRFTENNDDASFLQHCIQRISVSEEDFILAKQLYSHIVPKSISGGELPSLSLLLGYSNIQGVNNNSPESARSPPGVIHIANLQYSPAGLSNNLVPIVQRSGEIKINDQNNIVAINEEFGSMTTYEEYLELMSKLLVFDDNKRITISKCLNMNFFSFNKSSDNMIRRTRRIFDIDDIGNWIFKDSECIVKFLSCDTRKLGMKWFITIYNNRFISPINLWYSHEIFFHAMEMFDRFLLKSGLAETDFNKIKVYVNTFLFISSKYFRILLDDRGLQAFLYGFMDSEKVSYFASVQQFEEHVIQKVFDGEVYRKTIYEHLHFFISDKTMTHLIELYAKELIPNGTTFDNVVQFCVNYINSKQTILSAIAPLSISLPNTNAPLPLPTSNVTNATNSNIERNSSAIPKITN